jgi:rhodanese-related sulfurtransferase
VTATLIIGTLAFVAVLLVVLRTVRARDRARLQQHSITTAQLHSLLESGQDVLLLDVRQPLDLLAYPEILPGARRIPPDDVLVKPSLIPRDRETVVYCTCPGEKTSRQILRKALDQQFTRIKFLQGGLAAWKADGYPVEAYRESFQLHVAASGSSSK